MLIVLIYLVVGLFFGIRHVSTGTHGKIGPVGTVIFFSFLWPLLVIRKG